MTKQRLIWWLVFSSALLPSLIFAGLYFFNPRALGIDPIETLLQDSGEWALRFLLISLACSPLRRLGWKTVVRFRRMLGLYSFYYASLHLLVYVLGWVQLEWSTLIEDVTSRPFIYIGMIAWLILLILAVTSPKVVVKLLKRRWVLIHRLVYVAASAVLVHLWMQSRASAGEALLYIGLTALLFVERIYRNRRAALKQKAA